MFFLVSTRNATIAADYNLTDFFKTLSHLILHMLQLNRENVHNKDLKKYFIKKDAHLKPHYIIQSGEIKHFISWCGHN